MKLIYVAGRYTATTRAGVEANIAQAVEVALQVAALGAAPLCPHSNTGDERFSDVQPYQFWIKATLEMLRCCDALITVPGWETSIGARGEVAEAFRLNMPLFHSEHELKVWLDAQTKAPTC